MLAHLKRVARSYILLALCDPAAHAAGPGSGITFQGEAFIEAVNQTCTQDSLAVGDYYRVVYRYKNTASDRNDAAMFITTSAIFRTVSTGVSGSLNGQTATLDTIISGYAILSDDIAGASSLVIASNGGLATPDAIDLEMVGTVDNFLNFTGCTVTIHANMVRRPG